MGARLIFVDTSFWYALWQPRDRHSADARVLLTRYQREPLLTTNYIRGETWTLVNRREGHDSAVRMLDRIDASPRLEIAHVSEELEAEAFEWLRRHDEREYSFVDATSFALMRRLGVSRAFAFDGDFAAAGFEELR